MCSSPTQLPGVLGRAEDGLVAEREADSLGALAINPNLSKQAERVGLVEAASAPAVVPAAKPGG